ncbi:MAG TPA: hypothetical protein PLV87_08030 [Opitutaceae bacterium]|nr:hypothetical protein [Opitutaceae bacterium]
MLSTLDRYLARQENTLLLDAFAKPEGMIEYETHSSIRDLIRLYGFEGARQKVAEMFMDEADRRSA